MLLFVLMELGNLLKKRLKHPIGRDRTGKWFARLKRNAVRAQNRFIYLRFFAWKASVLWLSSVFRQLSRDGKISLSRPEIFEIMLLIHRILFSAWGKYSKGKTWLRFTTKTRDYYHSHWFLGNNAWKVTLGHHSLKKTFYLKLLDN